MIYVDFSGEEILRYSLYIFCLIFLFGCRSTTTIKSVPAGADVYIQNVKMGITPFQYSDAYASGASLEVKLKKEGYASLTTVIEKTKFAPGPCIGGIFLGFPFIWILGYPDTYEFELMPAITGQSTDQKRGRYSKFKGIVLSNGETVYGEILRMNAEEVEIKIYGGKIKIYSFKDIYSFMKEEQ